MVDALLTRSLPTMPAFAAQDPSLEMVSQCLLATMEALGSASLRAVLRGRLQQGSGAAASKAVVSLAQALPTQRPADAQLREFMAAWMAALQLMVWCMLTACEQPAGVGQGSGGSRSSDSSSGGSRQARGGGSSGAAGSSGDARASAWECVPVAALPRLMQALQCLMDESIGPPGHPQGAAAGCAVLATKCTQLSTAVQQMHRLFASPASEDAYVAVLEAAAAGLQMQPLLVWLHAQLMQQLAPLPEGPDVRQAAALLSHALLSQLVLSPFGSIHWPEVASYGGSAAILAAERRLHTSAARFVHWLAGGGHLPWAAAPGLSAELSLELQQALQHIFQLAVTHHRCAACNPPIGYLPMAASANGPCLQQLVQHPSHLCTVCLLLQGGLGAGLCRGSCSVCQPPRGSSGGHCCLCRWQDHHGCKGSCRMVRRLPGAGCGSRAWSCHSDAV